VTRTGSSKRTATASTGPWLLGIDDDEREETKAREKALAAAAQILDRTPFREAAERTWWYRTA